MFKFFLQNWLYFTSIITRKKLSRSKILMHDWYKSKLYKKNSKTMSNIELKICRIKNKRVILIDKMSNIILMIERKKHWKIEKIFLQFSFFRYIKSSFSWRRHNFVILSKRIIRSLETFSRFDQKKIRWKKLIFKQQIFHD